MDAVDERERAERIDRAKTSKHQQLPPTRRARMPRDSSSSDSDAAPARRNPIRRKSSDEDAPARRDNGDRRARLEARRRAAESSDEEERAPRRRLDDEALTQRASTDARKRVDEASRDINEGLSAREMARRRVLARRKAREEANDSDPEAPSEQPVDPVGRGDGRARALERRKRMQNDGDALVPTSPKDEETGLSAREKARRRVLERRKLREAQAKNEAKSDGEDDKTKKMMDTTGLLGELGKDGDGTKLVRRATILRWADGASVFALLAFLTCYVGFFWLCLWDNQCIVHGSSDRHQNDPAILEESYAARSLFWVLCVCGFIVVPYVIVATDSARRIRVLRVAGEAAQKRNPQHWYYDRKYLWQAVVLALITSLVLIAAASERSTKIRHQYKSVTRNWERCEREAAANGVWIEHGSCPWDNSVRLFYRPEEGDEVEARGRPATIYRDRGDSYDVDYLDGELEREEHLKRSDMLWNEAGTIRRKRRTFLEHQVIVAATEAACLMAAALCLMASYPAGAGGGFSGDTLRLKKPLRAQGGGN